eukprot:5351203-Prymnesium_polylepis.1
MKVDHPAERLRVRVAARGIAACTVQQQRVRAQTPVTLFFFFFSRRSTDQHATHNSSRVRPHR